MNSGRRGVFIVMLLLAYVGLWQFSPGVRSVEIVGLFASGALAGAAVASFLAARAAK